MTFPSFRHRREWRVATDEGRDVRENLTLVRLGRTLPLRFRRGGGGVRYAHCLLPFLLLQGARLSAAPAPTITAAAAIVMDADTGQVLYAHNADQPRPVASLTKIMTAILVCERGDLDSLVKVSARAVGVEAARVYLQPGSEVSLRDLLWLALLQSDNGAANACAEAISGSIEAFVDRMNARAGELGLQQTRFANPHGLDAPDQFSTARDVAQMARHALSLPVFAAMVRTRCHVLADPRDPSKALPVENSNRLLHELTGAIGVKTGTTLRAGRCLCGAVRWVGQVSNLPPRTTIAVLLASDRRYTECSALLQWAGQSFWVRQVATAGEGVVLTSVRGAASPRVEVGPSATVQRLLSADEPLPVPRFQAIPLAAPVLAGTRAGVLVFDVGKDRIEVPAVVVRSVEASFWYRLLRWPRWALALVWWLLVLMTAAAVVRKKRKSRN